MADRTGTHELGPANGRVLVKTGREGLAARVGHDLTLEITRWSARVTFPAEGGGAAETLTAELDLGSLAVRAGSGGAKPLSDKDRRDIEKQAGKILGGSGPARFDSTRVVPSASAAGGGAIEGTLMLNGVSQPFRLTVTNPEPGRYQGSTAIRQTSFGLTPYSGFFGALKLRDEVQVEFEITIQEPPNGPV
ncbi:MAG TPA: YceI family protein [Trebonia sp.]